VPALQVTFKPVAEVTWQSHVFAALSLAVSPACAGVTGPASTVKA
jgi:hypothetical protein